MSIPPLEIRGLIIWITKKFWGGGRVGGSRFCDANQAYVEAGIAHLINYM